MHNTNNDRDLLNNQLSQVQTQLSQLTAQLTQMQTQLSQLPQLTQRITQIEENLLLVGDVRRYEKLRHYLKADQWYQADQETINLIMEISGHSDQEGLNPSEISKFPCNELQVIDRLWQNYSDGRFGFSTQVKIYQEVGGSLTTTTTQDRQLIEDWGKRLGWRQDNRWRKCSELDYSLNAPVGCHPSGWWNSPYGSRMTNNFLARLIHCQV